MKNLNDSLSYENKIDLLVELLNNPNMTTEMNYGSMNCNENHHVYADVYKKLLYKTLFLCSISENLDGENLSFLLRYTPLILLMTSISATA